MNIKRNTWHYRLLNASPFCQWDMPHTVCEYMWKLVACLALLTTLAVGTVVLPLMLLDSFTAWVRSSGELVKALTVLFACGGIITWGAAALCACVGTVYVLGEQWSKAQKAYYLWRYSNVAGPPAGPSLIGEWVRGVKGRYCTLVSYTE